MADPSSEKSIIALASWLETPVGHYVRAWEQAQLDVLTVDIFGFNAMQIGLPQINALAANRMPHKWMSNTSGAVSSEQQVAVTHDFSELPFATQSLDLVILPHVLEFATEPHQVLREVDRVLIPEGRVIVCGFNPASLWGLRQLAGGLSGAPFLPPEGEFISLPRLRDWLKLLNMEVDRGHFGCYAPPCTTDKWLRRYAFMEAVGERWWPYLGAVYVVQAIKRVKGMHLVGPVWTKNMAKMPGRLPATNKTYHSQ